MKKAKEKWVPLTTENAKLYARVKTKKTIHYPIEGTIQKISTNGNNYIQIDNEQSLTPYREIDIYADVWGRNDGKYLYCRAKIYICEEVIIHKYTRCNICKKKEAIIYKGLCKQCNLIPF